MNTQLTPSEIQEIQQILKDEPAQVLKIQALESTQLDSLAEALLDFNRLADKDSLVSPKSSLLIGMRLNI